MNREMFLWPAIGSAILIGAAVNWWMFGAGAVCLVICLTVLFRANPRGKATYADLVDAETRAFAAEEELIVERANAENHVRALLRAPKVSESDRVRDRDAALEWLHR